VVMTSLGQSENQGDVVTTYDVVTISKRWSNAVPISF